MTPRICLTPRLAGVGGMVSFQAKMLAGLQQCGYEVSFDLHDTSCDSILVIGGTRHLASLWKARRKGVRIVQRLNGMNWVHRLRPTGLRHFLRAEYGNLLLSWIRSHLADRIVYQSHFARDWWERVHGPSPVPLRVVYNGVDLSRYTPLGYDNRPQNGFRVLMVEGNLGGGYEMGLDAGIQLAQRLADLGARPLELLVVGKVTPQQQVQAQSTGQAETQVRFAGLLPGERIPEFARSAHLFYAADLHPACPNAVIEALACGLPVVAFDTGAIPELVTGDAGRIAPYGGDPWKLEPPDVAGLAHLALEVLREQGRFRYGARQRAEAGLDLDSMVQGYLDALLG